jgi:hypothetical protein
VGVEPEDKADVARLIPAVEVLGLKGCTKSQDYLGSRRRSIKPIIAM